MNARAKLSTTAIHGKLTSHFRLADSNLGRETVAVLALFTGLTGKVWLPANGIGARNASLEFCATARPLRTRPNG